jgi:hypothetical protein
MLGLCNVSASFLARILCFDRYAKHSQIHPEQSRLDVFPRLPSGRNEGLTTYEGNAVDLCDESRLHYFTYRSLSFLLARLWAEMFSEIVLVAYA